MNKRSILALAGAACALTVGSAHAGQVFWSIGISAPAVSTVISNAPGYGPVYAQPAPVYVQPAPVYVEPVYVPPRGVYRPAPVVVVRPPLPYYGVPAPVIRGGWVPAQWQRGERWDDRGHWERRDHGHASYRDGRDGRGEWRDDRDERRGDARNDGRNDGRYDGRYDGRGTPVPSDPRRSPR